MVKLNKYDEESYLRLIEKYDLKDTSQERTQFIERLKRIRKKKKAGYDYDLKQLYPHNHEYLNLAAAFSYFPYENKLSNERSVDWIKRKIATEYIDRYELIKEYMRATSNSKFKWSDFLVANKVILPNEEITNANEYAVSLIGDFIESLIQEIKKDN